MKWIKLAGSAYVNGALRHPHEGVLHLEDEEARRLLDSQLGADVSADFDAEQNKAPVESITAESGAVPTPPAEHPHQSEITPPVIEEDTQPQARKAAASKE